MSSAQLFRRFTATTGALALSALLVAPYEFAAATRSLVSATQASSVGWVIAVRAGTNGARATELAVARLGRQA